MLTLLLANWRYVVMALLLAYGTFWHWRAGVWEERHYTFVAQTKAIGEAQERATAAKILSDQLVKDTADAEHKASLDRLNATVVRLRADRSGRSYLSAPAPGSSNPERACLARADADRAIREFVEETSRLVEEGDRAVVGLDSAKKWAASIHVY